MAIIVYTPRMESLLGHLFEPRPQAEPRKRKGTARRRARNVFRFHIIHRQTAGNNGPGRRHKRG